MATLARDPHSILQIPSDVDKTYEPMGSKRKFWFDHQGRRGLFKERTRIINPSGEDWAEKIAAELARTIGLPAADCDLAVYQGVEGVVSWSVLAGENVQLVPGNEVLCEMDPEYPLEGSIAIDRLVAKHTVERILDACSIVDPPPGIRLPRSMKEGADVFVGYLLLDAWIGNTDRHHQNWGWIHEPEREKPRLSPTFDHGSSLGHELMDKARRRWLDAASPELGVTKYLTGGWAPIWGGKREPRQLRPVEAFVEAGRLRPKAARYWLRQLRSVTDDVMDEAVDRVPRERMTERVSPFCRTLLRTTRRVLLDAEPPILP